MGDTDFPAVMANGGSWENAHGLASQWKRRSSGSSSTFSSGLGVLTCISKLKQAENGIIASHDLYGGTKRFLNNVYNNYVIYVDFNDLNMNELIDFLEQPIKKSFPL